VEYYFAMQMRSGQPEFKSKATDSLEETLQIAQVADSGKYHNLMFHVILDGNDIAIPYQNVKGLIKQGMLFEDELLVLARKEQKKEGI
jgi:hypothetical protein